MKYTVKFYLFDKPMKIGVVAPNKASVESELKRKVLERLVIDSVTEDVDPDVDRLMRIMGMKK